MPIYRPNISIAHQYEILNVIGPRWRLYLIVYLIANRPTYRICRKLPRSFHDLFGVQRHVNTNGSFCDGLLREIWGIVIDKQ